MAESKPQKASVVEVGKIPIRDKILGEIESIIGEKYDTIRAAKTESFISRRLAGLTASSKPKILTFSNGVGSIERGFVHPDTKIQRNIFVDPLKVDDPEVYKILIESFRQYKTEPGWKDRSMREIAQQAIVRTVGVYFGNYVNTQKTVMLNKEFYSNHTTSNSDPISVSEFRGKGIAVCAEKGPTAENLLTFVGFDSELVMSTNNRLTSSNVDEEDGHIYLIVSNEKGRFIHDPTNSVVVSNPDGSFYNTLPSSYRITEEQYTSLKNGGQVEVKHNDLTWDGDGYKQQETVNRIYGGPKSVKI